MGPYRLINFRALGVLPVMERGLIYTLAGRQS